MLAGVPVMVIWRSDDPSMALAILICAPDIWRISLILVPWRPIMQPISWEEIVKTFKMQNHVLGKRAGDLFGGPKAIWLNCYANLYIPNITPV